MKKLTLLLLASAAFSVSYAQLYTPGGVVLPVFSGSNVGINTAAPAFDLDIHDGNSDIRLFNPSTSRSLILRSDGMQHIEATNDFFVQSDYNLVLSGSFSPFATNNGILFRIDNVNQMVFNNNSDLGIGTMNPISKVHTTGFYTSDMLTTGTGHVMTPQEGLVVANQDGTFEHRIDFTGNPMEFLAGDGSWQPGGPVGADYDWLHDMTTGDISMGYPNGPYAYNTVSIGAMPGNAAKLNVVHTTDATYPNGIIAEISGLTPGTSVGMDLRNGTDAPETIGVQSGTTGGVKTLGGRFWADGWSTPAMTEATGIHAFGIDCSGDNYGGNFLGRGGNNAYGIYTHATGGVNNYGIYTSVSSPTNNYALYANGNAVITGTLFVMSDAKLKKEVKSLDRISDKLMDVGIKSYTFKQDEFPNINLPEGQQYGVISQELQKLFPEFVKTAVHPAMKDKDGNVLHASEEYLTVNYGGFVPLLIKAHQEQEAALNAMQEEMNELRGLVASLQSNPATGSSALQGSSENVVHQNFPNPFGESTTIQYELADSDVQASLHVYDVQGALQLRFDGLSNENGQVQIDANSLKPGIYAYVLLVNGKQVDSKQMIVTK